MRLQFLKSGSFIQFDGGGAFRKRLQRSDEIARGGDGKMQQGGAIGPLFEKRQPQRIFAIDMDGVGNAAVLGARATDVFQALSADFVKTVRARGHAASYHDHVVLLFLSQLSWRGIAGGGQIQRLLRPAFQCGISGIGQHVDAALGAVEPAIDIMQQDFSGIGNVSPQILDAPRPA